MVAFFRSLFLSALLFTAALAIKSNTYEQDGYTLVVEDEDSGVPKETTDRLISTFFAVYPQLVDEFNTNAARVVTFTLENSDEGVAATGGAHVWFTGGYLKAHPEDIDVVTHEVMHVVQDYGSNEVPGWLVEGIADFARATYGVNNEAAGWALQDPQPGQNYDEGYTVTAQFLVWIEQQHPGAIKQFDAALRSGDYSADSWTAITGASVDDQWAAYTAGLQQNSRARRHVRK